MKKTGEDKHDFSEEDWNQVNATIRMLTVAVAQIALSMKVGDKSVDVVGGAFESMLGQVEFIKKAVDQTTPDNLDVMKVALNSMCKETSEQMQSFIVAFQFYDELSQRMSHVSQGLSDLSDLMGDKYRFKKASEWAELKNEIRSRYTIKNEIEMFDSVMKGMAIEEALEILLASQKEVEEIYNDVEMF